LKNKKALPLDAEGLGLAHTSRDGTRVNPPAELSGRAGAFGQNRTGATH
jgi:hypothetical protein